MPTYIDLSHTVHNGLVTYKGLPAAIVCDFLSREESRSRYAPETEFQIGKPGRISTVHSNRYADGKDSASIFL